MAELQSPETSILVRTKITREEWAAIRHEAIDREMLVSEYTAMLLRAGRECIPPINRKEKSA